MKIREVKELTVVGIKNATSKAGKAYQVVQVLDEYGTTNILNRSVALVMTSRIVNIKASIVVNLGKYTNAEIESYELLK